MLKNKKRAPKTEALLYMFFNQKLLDNGHFVN